MSKVTDIRVRALEQLYGARDGAANFERRWRRFEQAVARLPAAERQRQMDEAMDALTEWPLLAIMTGDFSYATHPASPSPTEQEIAAARATVESLGCAGR